MNSEEDPSHAISSFGKCLDDKLPILFAPSPYLRVRIDNRTDVIHDIFLLSALVMQGHAERCQNIKDTLYVDLGPTRDANVQIWDAQANEILDKIKDLLSWSWHAGIIGTLVEGIHYDVDGDLNGK